MATEDVYVSLRMTTSMLDVIIKCVELGMVADNLLSPRLNMKLTQEQRNEWVNQILAYLKSQLILAQAATPSVPPT